MKYKVGDIVIAKVFKVGPQYVSLQTKDSTKFFIYREDISDYKPCKIYDIFKIGDIVNFVCLYFNINKNYGYGSYKKNHPNELRTYGNYWLKETSKGFKNLINYMNIRIKEFSKRENNQDVNKDVKG
ncbi:hypothetical protein ACXYRK_00500 [Mycoplasma sp. AC1221]